MDGKAESLYGLGTSSGYLAIDNNADGRINDGSELFGTRSGNGFADLAKLDSDGNHWLDEADTGFNSLRIWQRDAAGQDTLSSLRDKGIGALYLGSRRRRPSPSPTMKTARLGKFAPVVLLPAGRWHR